MCRIAHLYLARSDNHLDDGTGTITSATSTSCHGDLHHVPLCISACKAILCILCGASSHAESPFVSAGAYCPYGRKHPWKRYRRHHTNKDIKVPCQKVCLLCHLVWLHSEERAAHAEVDKYLESVKGKPEEHKKFKKKVDALIKLIQADPDGYLVALHKHQVKSNRGPLVVEKKKDVHKRIQKYTFGHEAMYDQLYKGTAHAARFGPLKRDDEEDPGAPKGYWCRGDFNTHLQGHDLHQYEISDELSLEKVTNDPTMQLCKDQDYKVFAGAEAKRKAVFSPNKNKI